MADDRDSQAQAAADAATEDSIKVVCRFRPLNDTEEQRTLETMWKFGWGLVLSWVSFACVRGSGGIVNDFLSWGVWASISKISFMTYLFHMSLNWWISRDIL